MCLGKNRLTLLLLPVLALTLPAAAATDPDIDPASPVAIEIVPAADAVRIVSAKLGLLTSEDGLTYLRLDYELVNDGSEAVAGHTWRLDLGEAVALAVTIEPLAPGESGSYSQLIFGSAPESMAGGGGAVLSVADSVAVLSNFDCRSPQTLDQCEATLGRIAPLCTGGCIGGGAATATPQCGYECHDDDRGEHCCMYVPTCPCAGRSGDLSLIEALAGGLIDPSDPVMAPLEKGDIGIEVRRFR